MSSKKNLTKTFDDGSSFSVNPGEFVSPLARKRHAQSLAKNPKNTVDVKRDHFKATCPWCHATNVVMSPLNPRYPTTEPPLKGDVIKCDVCRRFHAVEQVNLDGHVKTFPVEVPQ